MFYFNRNFMLDVIEACCGFISNSEYSPKINQLHKLIISNTNKPLFFNLGYFEATRFSFCEQD